MRTSRTNLKRIIVSSLVPTGNGQAGNGKVSRTNGTDTPSIDPATTQAIVNNAARRIPSVRASSISSSRDFQI
ncbi:MAG: hypothetical protein A3B68_08815 [Candidatus Melainabacteria bacterium RIFCSPHIGHO2_02_FULL_34_12]|nr:MAG: hypothetical protein A3B68_08815 [Candidatus Melainabacteria bacterium RIFCSPHIGHO2_02_FULL_34_12]